MVFSKRTDGFSETYIYHPHFIIFFDFHNDETKSCKTRFLLVKVLRLWCVSIRFMRRDAYGWSKWKGMQARKMYGNVSMYEKKKKDPKNPF